MIHIGKRWSWIRIRDLWLEYGATALPHNLVLTTSYLCGSQNLIRSQKQLKYYSVSNSCADGTCVQMIHGSTFTPPTFNSMSALSLLSEEQIAAIAAAANTMGKTLPPYAPKPLNMKKPIDKEIQVCNLCMHGLDAIANMNIHQIQSLLWSARQCIVCLKTTFHDVIFTVFAQHLRHLTLG